MLRMLRVLGLLVFTLSVRADSSTGTTAPLNSPIALLPGRHELLIVSPEVLELNVITTPGSPFDLGIFTKGTVRLPTPPELKVLVNGNEAAVESVGYRQRVHYAPLKKHDLRISQSLYLKLKQPIATGAEVQVEKATGRWSFTNFVGRLDPERLSPVLHVNQAGYATGHPKTAFAGYYLGTLGELSIEARTFQILDQKDGRAVFSGDLRARPDRGFPTESYQAVLEADFSAFDTPGEYVLQVPGLGNSFPFQIGEGVFGVFARTYALGIYHQRCGMENKLPFTRFTHGPCHTNPAEVPTMDTAFRATNEELGRESENTPPDQKAPRMRNVQSSLFPFTRKGRVDVTGGHHDAGDYSKYTINSAGFVHHLMFAIDNFPGVADLDNLGLPESGDGTGDLLQEAKWEADFLARMQDSDGGFYFLVYPRNRAYEDDVTPDKGDPQVVWPKTTSVSAAAVAALSQCASSPRFKRAFPAAASNYLHQAKTGWAFLERAFQKFGESGAYQRITHYGDDFTHNDEIAWAACELFLATGEARFHEQLKKRLDPADPGTRKWGWWRLYDAYGAAIRSYGFAERSTRMERNRLDAALLRACEAEIEMAGEDQLKRSEASAYGVSFPIETKRVRSAGWFFPGDAGFDLATAMQLTYPENRNPKKAMLKALLYNLNYEAGANPVNISYLTGVGSKRQWEIVHQYAQNDRRTSPPTGIPLGAIQGGMQWLHVYNDTPAKLSWPSDSSEDDSYPFYDRWGDTFNLSQEFVILNQAKSLAYLAWLMAQSPLKEQKWTSGAGLISLHPNEVDTALTIATLSSPTLPLQEARILWEYQDQPPFLGRTNASFETPRLGPKWLEAEALLRDGRRVFAATNVTHRTVK